ncbi:MAG: TSUP family transporter [Deltaproteobacteria bacterium]|nr:TSUP family transporter [Deltaproteobacteria bacterium]
MVSYLIVGSASLVAAGITLYSGFGLGTLLMPVFAMFFPVEVAIAATAVVHASNNVFKVAVVGRHANLSLVLGFGLPAVVAAFIGAAALGYASGLEPLASYSIGPRNAVITPVKLVAALLIFIFAMFELLPTLRNLRFDHRHLFLGGFLSGFFGGLSGHQGALRSAFLVKTGMSTETFVGTNAVIGFMVDMARILTYGAAFILAGTAGPIGPSQWTLVLTATGAAFVGVLIGRRFLKKIHMKTVQTFVAVLLLGIALALGAGIV